MCSWASRATRSLLDRRRPQDRQRGVPGGKGDRRRQGRVGECQRRLLGGFPAGLVQSNHLPPGFSLRPMLASERPLSHMSGARATSHSFSNSFGCGAWYLGCGNSRSAAGRPQTLGSLMVAKVGPQRLRGAVGTDRGDQRMLLDQAYSPTRRTRGGRQDRSTMRANADRRQTVGSRRRVDNWRTEPDGHRRTLRGAGPCSLRDLTDCVER